MLGIYCYIDLKDGSIVYIGKDSHIEKNLRHKQHHFHSLYNAQPLNSILQNNPGRYSYQILKENVDSQEELNKLEMDYIKKYNPKFNFTAGGDGSIGYKHSNEAKLKISQSKVGVLRPKEVCDKISLNNARYWLGKKRPQHSERMKSENNPRYVPYYRIVKGGVLPSGKQNYIIMFNKKKVKQSSDKLKLIKWFKLNYPNDILQIKNNRRKIHCET